MGLTKVTYSMIEGAVINVLDYGAVGDGTTNNLAAFTSAIAASEDKTLYVPSGTYVIKFSTADAFVPPANMKIVGDGKGITTLLFQRDSTLDANCFNLAEDNFTLQNLTAKTAAASGGTSGFISLITGAANYITLDNCELDGTMTNSGSTFSHYSFMIKFPSTGTMTDTVVRNCTIHNFGFPFLKSNTWTSSQNRITVSGCEFYSNYNEDASFNSPLGSMTNVTIENCKFHSGAGTSASAYQLYAAFAGITGFIVTGCAFEDTISEGVHIESSSNGVVSNNVFKINVAANGGCVQVLEGFVSGYATCENIVISDNTMEKVGTAKEANKNGINIVFDGSPSYPGKIIVVSNNTIKNFGTGIYVNSNNANSCLVSNNFIYSCAEGLRLTEASSDVRNNYTQSCDVGIYSAIASVVESHTFNNCTVNCDAVSRPAVLINPSFVYPEFATTASVATYKPMVSIGANDRVYGTVTSYVFTETSPTAYEYWTGDVLWTGASLTSTVKTSINPFSAVVTDIVDNSGVLSVSVTTFVNRTAVRCTAKINGTVLVAV